MHLQFKSIDENIQDDELMQEKSNIDIRNSDIKD